VTPAAAAVIDVHIHYSPRVLLEDRLATAGAAGKQVRYDNGMPATTLHRQMYELDRHIEMMDFAGVDLSVLSSPEGWSYDLGKCRTVNDEFAKAMNAYPQRIVGMAHTTPFDAGAGFAELDRAANELGLKGVAITSSIQGRGLNDHDLWPFYEKVQAMGSFLFVHPALSCAGSSFSPEGFEAFDLYRTLGREYDLMSAVLRLVCGGVLDDFPELKVIVSHLGGAISPLLGRINGYQDKGFLGLQDDPVHGRTAKLPFKDYLSRLYFDTGGHFGELTSVQSALLNIPSSQIMFGTDYPQEIREAAKVSTFIEDLRKLDVAPAAIAGILGANARTALFGE
jgi:6-methylsalicylate decarboxylase